MSRIWAVLTLGALATSIGGCAVRAVSKMTDLADEMCECKTVDCAVDVGQRINKLVKKVDGLQSTHSQAIKFETEQRRAVACYKKFSQAELPR